MGSLIAQLREEGRAEGLEAGMISLVKKGLISEEIAAEEAGMSVEEFTQKMDAACICEDASEYDVTGAVSS